MKICKFDLEDGGVGFIIEYSEQSVSHGMHTHQNYELLYVHEGEVMLTIRGREYPVRAGSMAFLNQFDEHATRMIAGVYRRYYLLIPPTQLRAFHNDVLLLSVFRFHGENFPYVLDTGAAKPRFDAYFALLRDASERGGAYMDERVEALMTLILADALALRPDMFSLGKELSLLPMQEILDGLDRDFAQPFSLRALAERYHVSAGCLSAHFKKRVGVSPMQYVMLSRLNHAKVQLSQTELSVMEIAAQCGYGDVSNFVRRFRQQMGVTPLQYRKGKREPKAEVPGNSFPWQGVQGNGVPLPS